MLRYDPDDFNEPWSPVIVFKYRFNPSDLIGEYIDKKTTIRTSRGIRQYHTYKHSFRSESLHKGYLEMLQGYDRVIKGLVNNASVRHIPDTFTIAVGVVDRALLHQNPDGRIITYDELFEILAQLGFDPLRVVRRRQKQILEHIATTVRKSILGGLWSKDSILNKLRAYAAIELRGEIHDYIESGNKPSLKDSTTEGYRPPKLAADPSLYPEGIDEPLMETGQLLDAIDISVYAEQSDVMRHYSYALAAHAKEIHRELVSMKESIAFRERLKKDEEKARRSAELSRAFEKSGDRVKIFRRFGIINIGQEGTERWTKTFDRLTRKMYRRVKEKIDITTSDDPYRTAAKDIGSDAQYTQKSNLEDVKFSIIRELKDIDSMRKSLTDEQMKIYYAGKGMSKGDVRLLEMARFILENRGEEIF